MVRYAHGSRSITSDHNTGQTVLMRAQLANRFERFIAIHYTDPALVRRGRLLNIVLIGFFLALFIAMVYTVASLFISGWDIETVNLLLIIGMGGILSLGIYVVNRRISPRLAAAFLLFGLMTLLAFADEPQQAVSGRSTLYFALPILIASMIMWPSASFPVAALALVELYLLGVVNGVPTDSLFFIAMGFVMVALVSWLSARSLENALNALQEANRDLDRRVTQRTQDLSEALIHVQLEASKNQAILESIADGVVVFDSQGKVIGANPAVTRLLKIPPDEIIGYPLNKLLSGVISSSDSTALGRGNAQDSGTRWPTMRLKWGDKILSTSLAPIRIEQEGGRGMVAVFRDITREAELERIKNLFMSIVSHELRTPLGAIIGYSEILSEQIHGPLNDSQQSVVNRLVISARRLQTLVNDLLDRARLEAGQLKLTSGPVVLQTLLNDLLINTAHLAKTKELTFTTEIAPDLPAAVRGDAQRLLQILINLVSNAIKFTEQGEVTVRLYCVDAKRWAMQVADTGIGIPADEQINVFDLFRQVDSSATRKHGGTGLGLSIVKQLVTLMSGEIALVSEPGRGSTFTVTLPLIPMEEK